MACFLWGLVGWCARSRRLEKGWLGMMVGEVVAGGGWVGGDGGTDSERWW